jgi:3-phenylpropionate/trans-cinnamate dioxygenase ferredoxin subunit
MAWHLLCDLADLEDEPFETRAPDGQAVLVIRHAGGVRVVAATCPHQWASLAGGEVSPEGVLTCPHHGWRFLLADGSSPGNPFARLRTWPAKVEEGGVWIEA